ncbi:MAG TPA: hypothetical protein VJN88_13975 [Ktedonobacterales bacterium]|nr:hypothetical protein [Ktedonobacterales bacterium]
MRHDTPLALTAQSPRLLFRLKRLALAGVAAGCFAGGVFAGPVASAVSAQAPAVASGCTSSSGPCAARGL